MTRLYIGNIPWRATEEDLAGFLRDAGFLAEKITLPGSKDGPGHRGFGFAEFPDDTLARQAIAELNGADFLGRRLNVQLARPREERPSRGRGPR